METYKGASLYELLKEGFEDFKKWYQRFDSIKPETCHMLINMPRPTYKIEFKYYIILSKWLQDNGKELETLNIGNYYLRMYLNKFDKNKLTRVGKIKKMF